MTSSVRVPVDLRLLEPFVILAEELHFTTAAAKLHIAQPALSQQIRRLELQVGVELFHRSSRHVELTDAGRRLLRSAQPALAELRAAVSETRAFAQDVVRVLRVGHLSSLSAHEIPAVAARFRDLEPDVSLDLHVLSLAEQLDALRARHIDLGLFHRADVLVMAEDGLDVQPIGRCHRHVVLPSTHALASRRSIELEELADETWITAAGAYEDNFIAVCQRHGFTPRVRQRADSVDTMLGLVQAGLGLTVSPFARSGWDGLVFVALPDEPLEIVAARAASAGGAASDAFIVAARAAITELTRLDPAGP